MISMNKGQYFDRHRNLAIEQAELERKWRLYEEERLLMEALQQRARGGAAGTFSGGAGNLASQEGPLPDLLLAKLYGFYYVNLDVNNNWWIKIINFETSEVIDTDLGIDSNTYSRQDTPPIVQDSGFVPVFYDSDLGTYYALFIDVQGNIIGEPVVSSDLAWNYTENGLLRIVWDQDHPDGFSIFVFDGKNLNKFSFPDATGFDWGSYAEDATSDLTLPVTIYYPDKTESYLLRRNGVSKNVTNLIDFNNDTFLCASAMDFLVGIKWNNDLSIYTTITAISSDGVLLGQEDISSYNTNNWNDYYYYGGTNASAFVSLYNTDEWKIVHFNGTAFSTFTHVRYDAETDKNYSLNAYYNSPYMSENYDTKGNKLLFISFSDSSYDDFWDIYTDLELIWISKDVDFQSYFFGVDQQIYFNRAGNGLYGQTLAAHFATGSTSTVNIGIMTDTEYSISPTDYTRDFVTFISSAAFGNSIAYVFDLDDGTRRFYAYCDDTERYNSIPTVNWNWYYNSGGLLLLDTQDDANNVYVIGLDGSGIPLSQIPANSVNVYNDTDQYGRDGYSHEKMVLTENMGGEYKIWVLNSAGVHEGGNATQSNWGFELGRTVFTNIFQDGNYFVEVFSLDDGSLLYTADTGVQSPGISSYGDRVAFQEGANVYTVTLAELIQNPIADGNPNYAFNDMYWYWD